MNDFIPVTSQDDPRIAPYLQVKERDMIGRDGMFIAEGEVVLQHLVESPLMETLSVLITERQALRLAGVLNLLPQHVPVYVASQTVMDAIVGFHIHRGILAFGRRRLTPSPDELLSALPARAIVLGLVGIANHDNMGGIFRNAAAFGASGIIADHSCCDPLYRKAIRVSVGAALKVPFAKVQPGENMIDIMQRHAITPIALSPSGNTALQKLHRPPRVGVLLGAEGPGLPEEMLAKCQTVAIPMASGFDSLNVATTSGIVLYHLDG